jgi:hypothetical protein
MILSHIGEHLALLNNGSNGDSVPATVPEQSHSFPMIADSTGPGSWRQTGPWTRLQNHQQTPITARCDPVGVSSGVLVAASSASSSSLGASLD